MKISIFIALRALFVCGLLSAGIFLLSADAYAQSYARNFEMLSEINRLKPEQNPAYDNSDEILGRRIIDNKNRVIGDVKDVILDDVGNIDSLSVEFNRLRLNTNIFLSYNSMGIQPVTDGYTMGFSDDQIEQLYPTLLADIETAAGGDDMFSVRTVVGGSVKTDKGRKIGIVDDVLFGANGARAEALLVKLTQGTLRGDKVAVPFSNPKFEQAGEKKNVIISEDMARAIVDFAKTN